MLKRASRSLEEGEDAHFLMMMVRFRDPEIERRRRSICGYDAEGVVLKWEREEGEEEDEEGNGRYRNLGTEISCWSDHMI